MFNCIKIYLNSWYLEHDLQKDYIVQIDGYYHSIYKGYEVEHPDLSQFDVLLSTSSLDKLEIFILRLFMDKKRCFADDCLLTYLIGFFIILLVFLKFILLSLLMILKKILVCLRIFFVNYELF